MKKTIAKISAIFLAALSIAFTSCHDDLFGMIEKEVALDKSILQGDIMNMVVYKEWILTANGSIYAKTNQPSTYTNLYNHQWVNIGTPEAAIKGNQSPTTYLIASDENYLYALTYTWDENDDGDNAPTSAILFSGEKQQNTIKWTIVDTTAITNSQYDYLLIKALYDNQYDNVTENPDKSYTHDLSKRKAYATIFNPSSGKYGIYELNGSSAPTKIEPPRENLLPGTTEGETIKAIYFNDETFFSKYYGLTAGDKYLYFTYSYTYKDQSYGGSQIFCMAKDKTVTTVATDAGSIFSIAKTSDFILLGTASGLKRVPLLESGLPYGNRLSFQNNGGSIISEYVYMVYVLNPNKKESGDISSGTDEYCASTIYGSIGSSSDSWDDTGLYAYYPAKLIWNKDGN